MKKILIIPSSTQEYKLISVNTNQLDKIIIAGQQQFSSKKIKIQKIICSRYPQLVVAIVKFRYQFFFFQILNYPSNIEMINKNTSLIYSPSSLRSNRYSSFSLFYPPLSKYIFKLITNQVTVSIFIILPSLLQAYSFHSTYLFIIEISNIMIYSISKQLPKYLNLNVLTCFQSLFINVQHYRIWINVLYALCIIIKRQMGTCTTSSSQTKPSQSIPLIFHPTLQKQVDDVLEYEFEFQLLNVSILPVAQTKVRLIFIIQDVISIEMQKNNISVKPLPPTNKKQKNVYQIKWTQMHKSNFTCTEKQLLSKYLQVLIAYDNKQPMEIIKINLYMIVHGPFHHNIEIPINKQPFRVLFDAKMSHIFEADLSIRELSIITNKIPEVPYSHFTIKGLIEENTIVQSYPSYNIKLPSPNIQISRETNNYFQNQRPNINKMRVGNSFINIKEEELEKVMTWTEENYQNDKKTMPQITLDISTQEMINHSIQVLIWSSRLNDQKAEYIYEAKIPLWKILQNQCTEKVIQVQNQKGLNRVSIEHRTIKITQKLYSHHNHVGSCQITLTLKNEKIIEQLKYCSMTETGIVNLTPEALHKDIKSNYRIIEQLWKSIEEIHLTVSKAPQKGNLESLPYQISDKLSKLNDKVMLAKYEITYTDSNKQALINNQNILISLLQKIFPFVENHNNPTLSGLGWHLIYNILLRPEFTLEHLCLKGTYNTKEAKFILQKKKDVGKKYSITLNLLIKFALKGYGFINDTNEISLKFFTFCFFRVPAFQQQFFQLIEIDKRDEEVEKRLVQYQNQIEPKTSFTNGFSKMKTNWSGLFYDQLMNDPEFRKSEEDLRGNFKSKKWFMEIGYRDELYYNFICQILESLPKLNFGNVEKWKYVEGYSSILNAVMSEMKRHSPQTYSSGLIKSSIMLLHNQHLINLLLPLISQKTDVHSFQKVQVVLDIINEYLKVLTNNQTTNLGSSFNQNYFFSILRIVLEGQHFYSINKVLIIIYDYFNLMSEHGRYQISMFLLGSIFFNLYYHWSKDIRNTFYNILIIKIKHVKHRKNTEIIQRYNKALEITKIIEDINYKKQISIPVVELNIYKKLKSKVIQKMKNRTAKITTYKGELSIVNLLKIHQENSEMSSQLQATFGNGFSSFENQDAFIIPNYNTQNLMHTPQKKKVRSYSQSLTHTQLNEITQPNEEVYTPTYDANDRSKSHDIKGRKKRKPSLFFGNSPHSSTNQYSIINQLHYFSELTNEQIKNISRASVQFKEVETEIDKYIKTHDTLPEKRFDQINRKLIES